MIHKGGYEVNGYNDPNCMFQYQDVPRDTVAIATPNVWCFHNTFKCLHISNLWLRKPTNSMHSQPHAAHLNFDQPWGVQLVFCSLSPYDEVLGDFSEKKGGWPKMFFKDFWAFMGRNTRILSFTVPFRSKITLAERSFWSFLCGTDWSKAANQFQMPPTPCRQFNFFLKHLRVWHVWNVATCVGVPIISGTLSSGICRLRFSVAMLFFSLHVHQQWFQYRQIVPVSLLIVRWFAICTWLYHAAFFLVACSCWSKKAIVLLLYHIVPMLVYLEEWPADQRFPAPERHVIRCESYAAHGWIISTWSICNCQKWQIRIYPLVMTNIAMVYIDGP